MTEPTNSFTITTAGSPNTDPASAPASQEPQSIPYGRFQEVNAERKAYKDELDAVKARLAEIETQKLEEDKNFKALAEKARADAAAAEAKAAAAEAQALRYRIGTESGLPAAFVDRLRGTTEEEIQADAKALLKAIPKPAAPPTNAGQSHEGQQGRQLSAEERQFVDAFSGVVEGLTPEEFLKYAPNE